MKRLIKKSQIYEGFNRKNDYYEMFINPTTSEIDSIKKNFDGCIRGVIDESGAIYIWSGYILHDNINEFIKKDINVDTFRFAYEPNYWIFDAAKNYSYEEMKDKILKYKDILSRFGNINDSMNIYYATDLDFIRSHLYKIEEEQNNKR